MLVLFPPIWSSAELTSCLFRRQLAKDRDLQRAICPLDLRALHSLSRSLSPSIMRTVGRKHTHAHTKTLLSPTTHSCSNAQSDALKAVEKFDTRMLDNVPMQVRERDIVCVGWMDGEDGCGCRLGTEMMFVIIPPIIRPAYVWINPSGEAGGPGGDGQPPQPPQRRRHGGTCVRKCSCVVVSS